MSTPSQENSEYLQQADENARKAGDSRHEYHKWKIVESSLDPDTMAEKESLFALANGNFGIRGAFEEGTFSWNRGAYINGFYEERPIVYGERAYGFPEHGQTMLNVADGSKVIVKIDGEPLDLSRGSFSSYRRELDMREGVLSRSFTWTSSKGKTLTFSFERFVSLARRRGGALRIKVLLHGADSRNKDTSSHDNANSSNRAIFREKKSPSAEVTFISSLDGTSFNKEENGDPRAGISLDATALSYTVKERENTRLFVKGRTMVSRLSFAGAAEHSLEGLEESEYERWEGEREIGLQLSGTVEAGSEATLYKYIAYEYCTSEEDEKLYGELMEEVGRLEELGYSALREEQNVYLNDFWERSDVKIDGDPAVQQGIRFNIFHLLQSVGKDGQSSIAAKGLTGEGYEGHFFWDTEIYVLPFFIYTAPEIAGKLLDYRYSILPRARERARELSQQGALFPWRTINGKEASAYYPAGTAQYHIDADIVYGIKKYLYATEDREFLPRALEILVETARMWYDLGWFNRRRDNAFCIDGVTGPDEYTALVNNNYYTNIMARDNLLYAADMVDRFKIENPQGFEEVKERCSLKEEEPDKWREAGKAMYLPYDGELGIHPQDDSFLNKEVWPIETIPQNKRPLLLHYHPLVIYRKQVLKQADTVLALFLQGDKFAIFEKKRDFDYYDRLTTGDSSLSSCVQSIIASEIGYEVLAYSYFVRTARIDLDDVNGNVRDGVHTAAMAGTWAAIIHGFAGFRDYNGIMQFRPHLPRTWERLAFTLTVKNALLEVTITHNEVAYKLKKGNSLSIRHRGKEHTVYEGAPLVFSNRPDLEALVFDLDGVITDSAEYHYQAWKKLAEELQIPFDREFNNNLRGVGRLESLELILSRVPERRYTHEEKLELATKKNEIYKDLIKRITPQDLLPSIGELLEEAREAGIYIALASASRNAPAIVENLQIGDKLDVITDPNKLERGKPDPEQFFMAADMLGLPAENCIGIEDAQAGVDAINASGMFSVGVGEHLEGADWNVSDTGELTLESLREHFYRH